MRQVRIVYAISVFVKFPILANLRIAAFYLFTVNIVVLLIDLATRYKNKLFISFARFYKSIHYSCGIFQILQNVRNSVKILEKFHIKPLSLRTSKKN